MQLVPVAAIYELYQAEHGLSQRCPWSWLGLIAAAQHPDAGLWQGGWEPGEEGTGTETGFQCASSFVFFS